MVVSLIKTLRMYQWTKNLLVFAALVFGQQLGYPAQIARSLVAFAAFCAASSTMYILNDLMDMEKDKLHPEKRTRPLASGALPPYVAVVAAFVLCAGSIALSLTLGTGFTGLIVFYLVLTTLYSIKLKHIVILDVMVVAVGFVLRAVAGAVAIGVVFSNWLVVCTMFLALFLGLGKRRHEMQSLQSDAKAHRRVLVDYSVPYIDSLLTLVAAGALLTYTIYTCSPEVVRHFGTDKLYLTLPYVMYGLFRYLYLVQHDIAGGDPSQTLLKDRPTAVTVFLWAATCMVITHWRKFV